MINFWVPFSFLVMSWIFSLINQGVTVPSLLFSVTFFSLFFLLPLLTDTMKKIIFYLFPILICLTFWTQLYHPFTWFILFALLVHLSSEATSKETLIYSIYGVLSLFIPLLFLHTPMSAITFLILGSFFSYILYELTNSRHLLRKLDREYHSIEGENRRMKRQLLSGEKMIRQEERNEIARELHDSVGHRLTALLMQLEAARVQTTDENTKEKIQEFKTLAQKSLKDTRKAVYAMKSDERSGIQAIIQLIKKLEAESHLAINFIVQSGIFNMRLTNEQSATMYRGIQESLTNMMRHSETKKATIEFSLLGNRIVQFKVSHAMTQKRVIKEGFGLSNMRNRLEELGGSLEVIQTDKAFTVIGKFPLERVE